MTTTAQFNEAADTCKRISDLLRSRGWYDHKISHFRRPEARDFERGLVHTAIEVGYVTGECTVRLNSINGQVDQGTSVYMRGIGAEFVQRVGERLVEIERNIQFTAEGRMLQAGRDEAEPRPIYEEQV